MKAIFGKWCQECKQPHFAALVLLASIPLFPEYISFLLVIAAAVFARKDLQISGQKLRLGFIGKLLVAYCAYQTMTCIISTHPFQSFAVSLMWWFFLIAYLIVVNLLIDTQRIKHFLFCMTAAAGLVGLIACIQYRINFFTGGNVGCVWAWLDNIVFEIVSSVGEFDIFHLNYDTRAYSTFPNPNMLAQYLVMAAPLVACYNFMEEHSKGVRLFARVCLFLTFAGVMFSFSRGGYIALILLAAALIVLNFRQRFAEIALYIASALLFVPGEVINRLFSIKKGVNHSSTIVDNLVAASKPQGGTSLLPHHTTAEIVSNAGAEKAVGERWVIWAEARERFFERPLFGYGAGTQPTLTIYENIGVKAPHAHNIVLQLLLEGGIIALLIMCLIGLKTAKNGFVLMHNHHDRSFWVGFGIIAFVVCFLSHGMVDYPLMVPRLVCFFIIALGLAEQVTNVYRSSGYNLRAPFNLLWLKSKKQK